MTLIRCLQIIGGVQHNVNGENQLVNNQNSGETIKFDDNKTSFVVPNNQPPSDCCGTSEPKNPQHVMLF
ncbi:hypothetical protein DICPUDRAFT_158516 [Dictyostelium purpureum]|uniref:Uncharacterized protein n=1 Tax=Dictyostelium purpureum TaxID=5786 RepID=F1A1T0_DICPU|nr:uncharacterized protein DICPUDRAFT_158516 [Dictyostelium purpureum]EGC29847.1 hypothetical protein DICPUDRAFT_158516 [Dictyostelium purpureum]|eukprot:XP_003293621.1 hypothetical protein DICPUDRAFT_158516 [Dictyostelium purpureum]